MPACAKDELGIISAKPPLLIHIFFAVQAPASVGLQL